MSTRQTLKDYLADRGLPSINTISYNNTITSGDSPVFLDEGDDLSVDPNTGRPLIHAGRAPGIVPDYLGYITTGEGNTYPIDGTDYQEAPSSNRGESLQPPEDQGAVDVFKASSEFPVVPSYFDGSGNPITSIIDKVGNGSAQSGPALIDEVKAAEVNSDLFVGQSRAVTSTFAMLKKYNKYADVALSSDPRFVQPVADGGDDTSTTFDDAVTLNFQRSSGEYKIGDTDTSRQTPMSDMHEIAHSMLLKAAGWDTTTTAYDSLNPDEFFDSFNENIFSNYPNIVSALYPDQVRPRESYGAPTVGESSLLGGMGEAVQRNGSDAKYSLASTNTYTPDIVFAPETLDQQERAQLGYYQAGISIVGLSVLIQQTINDFSDYTTADNELLTLGLGPFYMGHTTQSKAKSSLRAISNIALVNTGRFSFEKCVKAGVMLYFGIDMNDAPATLAVNGPVSAFENSGLGAAVGQRSSINTIAGPNINQSTQDRLAQSYGFWQSVAKSCVKLISDIENALGASNTTLYANLITYLLKSKSLRIANVFAQIGYTYLIAHLEQPTKDSQQVNPQAESSKLDTPFSIDSFESLPGTRVMKSRDKYARSALALAWRHSSIPSALLLPPTLIQASLDMDYILKGPNPVKQLASTTLQDKMYVSVRNQGRIPIEVVNNLENRLDAEYVPFYFHDLRTNEIVGLHAFLDSLTDNYSAEYSRTQAYGRADTVKNYSNTKRSIGFTFWVVSTSEDDFDEMWSKVNKLVTLVYPQYTKGTLVTAQDVDFKLQAKGKNFRFEQPFSQVVGGTPVIRLRIGDVIKSNYSRFNLSRLFGAGNTETGTFANVKAGNESTTSDTARSGLGMSNTKNLFSNIALLPLLVTIGSPIELSTFSNLQMGAGSLGGALFTEAADLLLKNGFVNPLLPGLLGLASPNSPTALPILNSATGGRIFLKPRSEPYVFTKGQTQVNVKVTRPIAVDVTGLPDDPSKRVDPSSSTSPIAVSVKLATFGNNIPLTESFIFPSNSPILAEGATCNVTLDQCLFDPDSYFSLTLAGLMTAGAALGGSSLAGLASQVVTTAADVGLAAAGFPSDSTDLISDFLGSAMRQWTAPTGLGGTVAYAMEDSMSRGLAGVVTSMNFTWIDQNTVWDTRWNSRAPMACKITMAFDPIHDISPGLDVYGANRAPVYNVGATRLVAGDPISVDATKSRAFYERNGNEPQLREKIYN
jgi:hypothetical protein